MKKFAIAIIIALLALTFVAVPALAWDGHDGHDGHDEQSASADVWCDGPEVDNENPVVGDVIIFYGTVHVDASAVNEGNYDDDEWHTGHGSYKTYYKNETGAYVIINASGYLVVSGPDSAEIDRDDFDWSTDYVVGDTGSHRDEDVDADKYDSWYLEVPVTCEVEGDYVAVIYGEASAEYGHWVQTYVKVGGGCCGSHWEPVGPIQYIPDDDYGNPAFASCTESKTVTALANAPLSTGRVRPILTVLTPVDSELFFTSDGWGDPTSDVIVHNDGTWQVEIADGTKILLDGEWHRHTWIEVDGQGNVIGRYGYDGHIIATDIALSSPITVTKVG